MEARPARGSSLRSYRHGSEWICDDGHGEWGKAIPVVCTARMRGKANFQNGVVVSGLKAVMISSVRQSPPKTVRYMPEVWIQATNLNRLGVWKEHPWWLPANGCSRLSTRARNALTRVVRDFFGGWHAVEQQRQWWRSQQHYQWGRIFEWSINFALEHTHKYNFLFLFHFADIWSGAST